MKKRCCHSKLEIARGDFELLEEILYLRTRKPTLVVPTGASPGLTLWLDTELEGGALCPPGRHPSLHPEARVGVGRKEWIVSSLIPLPAFLTLELYFWVQLEYYLKF